MSRNKYKCIICILVMVCMLGLSSFAYASGFFESGKGGAEKIVGIIDGNATPFVYIQSIVMAVGAIVAVVVALVYGIQWVMATPAKKQQLKSALVPILIGVTLLVIGPSLTFKIVEWLVSI